MISTTIMIQSVYPFRPKMPWSSFTVNFCSEISSKVIWAFGRHSVLCSDIKNVFGRHSVLCPDINNIFWTSQCSLLWYQDRIGAPQCSLLWYQDVYRSISTSITPFWFRIIRYWGHGPIDLSIHYKFYCNSSPTSLFCCCLKLNESSPFLPLNSSRELPLCPAFISTNTAPLGTVITLAALIIHLL